MTCAVIVQLLGDTRRPEQGPCIKTERVGMTHCSHLAWRNRRVIGLGELQLAILICYSNRSASERGVNWTLHLTFILHCISGLHGNRWHEEGLESQSEDVSMHLHVLSFVVLSLVHIEIQIL